MRKARSNASKAAAPRADPIDREDRRPASRVEHRAKTTGDGLLVEFAERRRRGALCRRRCSRRCPSGDTERSAADAASSSRVGINLGERDRRGRRHLWRRRQQCLFATDREQPNVLDARVLDHGDAPLLQRRRQTRQVCHQQRPPVARGCLSRACLNSSTDGSALPPQREEGAEIGVCRDYDAPSLLARSKIASSAATCRP